MNKLGLPIATEKTEGPLMRLTFLGIDMDTKALVLCLPFDKLTALRNVTGQWKG